MNLVLLLKAIRFRSSYLASPHFLPNSSSSDIVPLYSNPGWFWTTRCKLPSGSFAARPSFLISPTLGGAVLSIPTPDFRTFAHSQSPNTASNTESPAHPPSSEHTPLEPNAPHRGKPRSTDTDDGSPPSGILGLRQRTWPIAAVLRSSASARALSKELQQVPTKDKLACTGSKEF